jgi:hypothetical protein
VAHIGEEADRTLRPSWPDPGADPGEYRGGVLRRLLPWAGVAAIVVAALVTAGWHNEPASVPQAPTPSPDATALSASEAKRVVREATLVQGDLPGGFRMVASGSGLSRPSLDLCGLTFDSERFRLASHRVVLEAPNGGGRITSVVVAFQPGYAARAIAELEATAPRCSRPVRPSAQMQPDLLALRVRVAGASGVPPHDLLVERRGDVLSLLDVDDRLGRLTLPIARGLGNRLEALQPVR